MYSPTSNDSILQTIGGGGYSKVYLVNQNGILLSRKDIDSTKISQEEFLLIQNEVSLLQKMRDRNVIMYKSSYFNPTTGILSIYTEYFPNGDLANEIENHRKSGQFYNEKEVIKYLKDMCKGLQYIHGEGIIHRDLKPANIFIGENNKLVLGDFGIAISSNQKSNQLIGTAGYIAPELWVTSPPLYTPSSDVFSLGCILYEIYTLRYAYTGRTREDIRDLIMNVNYFPPFNQLKNRSNLIEQLIGDMINRDMNRRLSISNILSIISTYQKPSTNVNRPISLKPNISQDSGIIVNPSQLISPQPINRKFSSSSSSSSLSSIDDINNNNNNNDNDNDNEIIDFYLNDYPYHGYKYIDYCENEIKIIQLIQEKSLLYPHLNQSKPSFTVKEKEIFLKNENIKNRYYKMIKIGCENCGYKYPIMNNEIERIRNENDKDTIMEILIQMLNSIKDIYLDEKSIKMLNEYLTDLRNTVIIHESPSFPSPPIQQPIQPSIQPIQPSIQPIQPIQPPVEQIIQQIPQIVQAVQPIVQAIQPTEYNPQQQQQPFYNQIIQFYTSKTKFNDKYISEYANMMNDPVALQNIDFYHHLPMYMPLLNQINPPFSIVEKIEFQNNMIIKSGYIPMVYLILIKYGYIIHNNKIELIHQNGIYEKWKNQDETKIVVNHIKKSIIDIYDGILYDNNNNNIVKCIDCILQADNQPYVLPYLPNQTLYAQQQQKQQQQQYHPPPSQILLPPLQPQQVQYQLPSTQQQQFQLPPSLSPSPTAVAQPRYQYIYQPFPQYQQYNPQQIISQYPSIISFYEGNERLNGKLVGEYHEMFNTLALQKVDFLKDMFFYFPVVNQPNPRFREEDKEMMCNNDVIKLSYINMVKVVLSKYGYTLIAEPLGYGKIRSIFEKWRYNEETIRLLNQIRGSMMSIFGNDDIVQILDKILCDNNRNMLYVPYGSFGNQHIRVNNERNSKCPCAIM